MNISLKSTSLLLHTCSQVNKYLESQMLYKSFYIPSLKQCLIGINMLKYSAVLMWLM